MARTSQSNPGPSSQSQGKRTNTKTTRAHRKQAQPRRRSHTLREIRFYQNTTSMLIPRLPFARVIREVSMRLFPTAEPMRWQRAALECIQEAAEAFVVSFLSDANLAAHHAGRVTLMVKDVRLVYMVKNRLM